jgi:hypothetical protein
MARNQIVSGSFVECNTVPAICEVCLRQALHWNSLRGVPCASVTQWAQQPQRGHRNPPGQRHATTCTQHLSSSP